jgi:hypothetical protein
MAPIDFTGVTPVKKKIDLTGVVPTKKIDLTGIAPIKLGLEQPHLERAPTLPPFAGPPPSEAPVDPRLLDTAPKTALGLEFKRPEPAPEIDPVTREPAVPVGLAPSPYQRPLPSEAPTAAIPIDAEPKPTTKLIQPRREVTEEGYPAIIGKQLVSGAVTALPKIAVSAAKIAERFGKSLEDVFVKPWEQELAKLEGRPNIEKVPVENLPLEKFKRGISKVEKYFEPKIPTKDKYKNIAADFSKGIGELGVLYATGGTGLIIGKEGSAKMEEALNLGASFPKAATAGTAKSLMTALKFYLPAKVVAHPALTTFAKRFAAGGVINAWAWVSDTALEMAVLDKKLLGKKHTAEEYENRLYGALVTSQVITLGQAISLSAKSRLRPRPGPRVEKDVTPPPGAPAEPLPIAAPPGAPPVVRPPIVPVTPPVIPVTTPPISPAEPVPVKKLRKGQSILKLTASKIETLKEIKTEVEAGAPGKRVFVGDKVTGEPSTYPEYYKNRNLNKEEVLSWIDKTLKGEGTTGRMQNVVNELIEGKRAPIAKAIIEERGKPGEVPAIELDKGDTYKIYGEEFQVKEVQADGDIVVQDGERKVLGPDDIVQYDRGTLEQKKPAMPDEDILGFPYSTTAAETGLYKRTEEAPLIEMPEVVELAKEINEGKYPKIKEVLRDKLGQLQWKGGPTGKADITLRSDLFAGDLIGVERVKPKDAKVLFEAFKEDFIEQTVTEESGIEEEDLIFRKDYNKKTGLVEMKVYHRNPQLAPNVMAHEVGHLVDWLPDKTLKRGNILGRIKSLKGYMIQTIDALPVDVSQALTSKDRGRLRRQALLEIGKSPGKDSADYPVWQQRMKGKYNALVSAELGAKGLITRDEIMQELKALSQARKPFDVTTADPKYLKYRYSSPELYADAVSAFINTPQLFKQKAPKFSKAFIAYMKNKPKVKTVYDSLVARGEKGREAIVDKRIDKTYEMFKEGDLARQEMHKRSLEVEEGLKDTLTRWLVDKYHAELKPIRQQEKMGGKVGEDAREARYALEEIPYLSSSGEHYFYNVFNGLIKPAEAQGISSQDIGTYMFLNRVAKERTDIANPLGYTKKDAIEMLESLAQRWGAEKLNAVIGFTKQYNMMRNRFILSEVEGSGLFTPELMEHIKNNPDYAKFSVHKFLEDKFGSGTTAKIYKQVGTLSEIENPLVATILQDVSLLRAAVINNAKRSMVTVLETSGQIVPADLRYSVDVRGRVPKPPKDPKLGVFTVMIDGKPQHFYVSKTIVDSFKHAPLESTKIARVWASINDVFRNVLVSKNPLWMARNVVKDFKATIKNNPEVRLRDVPKLIQDYKLAFKEVWADVMKGEKSEDIQTMLRERMLLSGRAYSAREATFDTELDRIATEYNIYGEAESRHAYNLLGKLWDHLDKLGKVSEQTGKVAGYKYLKYRTGLPPKALAHRVRSRISTPDVKRQGALQQITNNIFMFSNVGKEGIRSSWESFKEDKAGYIWKTIATNIMPKLILAGAAISGGIYFKKVLAGISDYDKKHYTIIPLWLTDDGKSVYIRIPEDYQGQLFGALIWDIIHGRITGKDGAIKTLSEALPYQLHPALQVGSDLFQYYIMGNNPQDEYRGRPVIPNLAYETGGIEAHKAMARHAWRNVGGKLIYEPPFDIEKKRSTSEEILNTFPFSIIGTFIKISDRGQAEQLDRIINDIRRRGAETALSRQMLIKQGVNDEKSLKEVKKELIDRGLYTKQVRRQFKKYRGFKIDNPYVNALSAARNSKERGALKKKYREELGEEKYREILKLWAKGKKKDNEQ